MEQRKAFFSVFFFIITALFVVFGYLHVSRQINDFKEETKKGLKDTSAILSAAVGSESLGRLRGDILDLQSDDYIQVKDKMIKLGKVFFTRDVDALYFMRRVDGRTIFLVESTPPTDSGYVPPGEMYEKPSPELERVFLRGEEVFVGPYTDEYGTYVSYFAPIRDVGTNEIIAASGVDIDYATFKRAMMFEEQKNILVIFLIYGVIVLAVFTITRRIEWQKKIKENEERLRVITETIPDAVSVMNTDGIISFWNRAAELLTGFSHEDAIGKNFCELVSLEARCGITNGKSLKEFIKEQGVKNSQTFEIGIKTKSGDARLIEFTISPITLKNSVSVVGALRDITEKKENEEILKLKSEELEKLNQFMMNREEKMIELKEELEKLRRV